MSSIGIPPPALPSLTGWTSKHLMDGPEFDDRYKRLKDARFRLTDISGCWDGRTERFTDIWEEYDGRGWRAHWGLPIEKYQDAFNDMKREGFRPVRLSFYPTPYGVRVCALWLAAEQGLRWEARHGLSRKEYQDTLDSLKAEGFRPVDITGYEDDGQEHYAAVFEQRPGVWAARHHRTFDEYQADFLALGEAGYVLDKVTGYTVRGETLYAAIWTQRTVLASFGEHKVGAADYQRVFDDRLYQGCRPRQLVAYAAPGGLWFAGVWESDWYDWGTLQDVDSLIDTYLSDYAVPGLSLALSQDGRLVFARARGLADQAASTALSVRHRMRVASVSKPVTAAAVMLLVQQGSLKLSDPVLGTGALLGTTYGTRAYSANEKAITVEHLLTHSSGFMHASNDDPMFQRTDLSQAELIGWALDNRDPANTPGTRYFYLNFGYCLLGRVIEQVTGQTYQAHVQSALLNPAGVTSMQIAADTQAARATDEVVYHGQGGEKPYDPLVSRMDAHGGWIATPIDLLRLLRVIDGRDGDDLLTPATVTTMTTVPTGVTDASGTPTSYAHGWGVAASDDWNHNGSLPGTLALLWRRPGGIGFCAAVNSRPASPNDGPALSALYTLARDVQTRLGALPPFTLFS